MTREPDALLDALEALEAVERATESLAACLVTARDRTADAVVLVRLLKEQVRRQRALKEQAEEEK